VVFELARWARDTPPAARSAAAPRLIEDLTLFGTAGLLAAPPTSET